MPVEEQDSSGQYAPLVDENGFNEQGEREVIIAVMGMTGTGKSYLISQITGQDVVLGHGLGRGKHSSRNRIPR